VDSKLPVDLFQHSTIIPALRGLGILWVARWLPLTVLSYELLFIVPNNLNSGLVCTSMVYWHFFGWHEIIPPLLSGRLPYQ